MYEKRLGALRGAVSARGADSMLVTSLPNIFYLSGFTGSTAILLVTMDSAYILVDPRYTTQAKQECPSTKVVEFIAKAQMTAAAELVNDIAPRIVAFESDFISVANHRALRRRIIEKIKLRSTAGVIEKIRRIKDSNEIALIRDAAIIVDKTFAAVLDNIRPGMTENELALFIDTTMRKLGAHKPGFETVAATGANAACAHHSPTDDVLARGHLVKMDYGAAFKHYNSDITRTICLGEATAKQREIYSIVLDAQMKAIQAIEPGKTGSEIDAVARDYISSKGYGANFGHGLGHALGVEVHDGPGFSKLSDLVLEPGMVITVEPGIYIEDWGGVRIEDDIIVTDSGVEVITFAPKEFLVV